MADIITRNGLLAHGPIDEISFDIKTQGTVDPDELVSDVIEALSINYDIEDDSHEVVQSGNREYIHVNITVDVDEESDLEILEYIIRGVPVADFDDIEIEILNIEQEYIPEEGVEEEVEPVDDIDDIDMEEPEVTGDEGLYTIDDEEEDGTIELQEFDV